jgi:hypothetical protein
VRLQGLGVSNWKKHPLSCKGFSGNSQTGPVFASALKAAAYGAAQCNLALQALPLPGNGKGVMRAHQPKTAVEDGSFDGSGIREFENAEDADPISDGILRADRNGDRAKKPRGPHASPNDVSSIRADRRSSDATNRSCPYTAPGALASSSHRRKRRDKHPQRRTGDDAESGERRSDGGLRIAGRSKSAAPSRRLPYGHGHGRDLHGLALGRVRMHSRMPAWRGPPRRRRHTSSSLSSPLPL